MGKVETQLASMGLSLEQPRKYPSPNRRGCVRVGAILFVSGHGSYHPGTSLRYPGKLGRDMTVEQGYEATKAVALAMLSTIKGEVGDLDRVKRVIRLFGMVNATQDFHEMPRVIDGASDLFFALYGPDFGCHARTAVGMASLPRGQAVEINGEFEVAD